MVVVEPSAFWMVIVLTTVVESELSVSVDAPPPCVAPVLPDDVTLPVEETAPTDAIVDAIVMALIWITQSHWSSLCDELRPMRRSRKRTAETI